MVKMGNYNAAFYHYKKSKWQLRDCTIKFHIYQLLQAPTHSSAKTSLSISKSGPNLMVSDLVHEGFLVLTSLENVSLLSKRKGT